MLDKLAINAPDVMLHLAGAGIADKRWSKKQKAIIYDSRINGTQWLTKEILSHEMRPKTFLCASAIGYYGHRPGQTLSEDSEKGENFVAKIAADWESSTQPLNGPLTRVINLRFGMILSPTGGALKDMIMPFKMGLGGRLGNGQQQYSWIGINDAIKAIKFLIEQEKSQGVYNLTTPKPVSNKVFTKTLADTLSRPAFMHMPAIMVRLIFGELADELLLADAHVLPTKLIHEGFVFDHPELSSALAEIIK
jgi:hypothetical protein